MTHRTRQALWLGAAVAGPVLLTILLIPLRTHVQSVVIAVVLLVVLAGALARENWPLRLLAAVTAAISFDFFITPPVYHFDIRSAQNLETDLTLAFAIPLLGGAMGRLYGREAARERTLRQQVETLNVELRASRRRIVTVGDDMRQQIERNLHDGVQQSLVTLSLMLTVVKDGAPDSLRPELDEVSDGLLVALDELRDVARGLHPSILVEAGLAAALRALARRSALPVHVEIHGDGGRPPLPLETTAYYVAAEAYSNAAKHASPSKVVISVTADPDGTLTLTVNDDGAGGADASRGSGITGMRDRAEAMGGSLTVDSPPGQGTTVTLTLQSTY
jgi:signal transduction histidine kinase